MVCWRCAILFVACNVAKTKSSAIVLLGPSGSGKSETGNTLTDSFAFKVSDGLESETRHPSSAWAEAIGRQWQVVDTPGYFDTTLSSHEQHALLTEFADLVDSPITALVFVVPYGRFGDAHLRAWRLALESFGPTAINHTVLAFTGCGEKSSAEVAGNTAKLCDKTPPPIFCEAIGRIPRERTVAFGELHSQRRATDRMHFFDTVHRELINKEYHLGDFLQTQKRRRRLADRVGKLLGEERSFVEELLIGADAGSRSYDDVARALNELDGFGNTEFRHVDFEDRSLGPFTQVGPAGLSSWRQPIAVPYTSMRGTSAASGQGGRLLLHTASDSGVRLNRGDERQGELRSSPFVLGRGDISWEACGNGGFVAVCPAHTVSDAPFSRLDGCVEHRLKHPSTTLVHGALDEEELSDLAGSSVVLRIVDDRNQGWGFVAMDNLRYPVMTSDSRKLATATNATNSSNHSESTYIFE